MEKRKEELNTAVLFLIFNRPDTTKQVFETIRQARPPRLYIASDGHRNDREGELLKVQEARAVVALVDWPCEVRTLYREENLGCKYAVSGAIDWFFENEEQGIILEDDCLPSLSFFSFCEDLLERYKVDQRVWQISGSLFYSNAISETKGDYFFSRYGPIWGWASWRRAWKNYDVELSDWAVMSQQSYLNSVYLDDVERAYKLRLGDRLFRDEINTWDYQWGYCKNYNGALTILPKKNLIVNIGFREDATHTTTDNHLIPTVSYDLDEKLSHPDCIFEDINYQNEFSRKSYRSESNKYMNRLSSFCGRLLRIIRVRN